MGNAASQREDRWGRIVARGRGRPWLGGALALGALVTLACGAQQQAAEIPPEQAKPLESDATKTDGAAETKKSKLEAKGPKLPWAQSTFSPQPGSVFDPELEPLIEVCGRGDVTLHETASWVAKQHHEGKDAPNLDDVKFHLRRHGGAYVMPRLWSATMRGASEAQVLETVEAWATNRKALGEYRCGAGMMTSDDGMTTISVLQVDVLAELRPLPTHTKSGEWLDLEVNFLVPTTAANVVLLPPGGAPRTLQTKGRGRKATARFSVATPGTWLVQVMATMVGGPRPVVGALITADVEPPSAVDDTPVPGEASYDAELPASDALFDLMNAARKDEGLPLLKRSSRLDRVAAAHSSAMLKVGRISHDTGNGDPAHRVAKAGLTPKATGENVALAQSVPRLHRVLWASPSHRGNLLMRRWDHAGVAIAERDDGTLFATQIFSDQE